MRHYRLGAHTETDLKWHVIWIPKYRKPILVAEVAVRVRELGRTIAAEHELEIISGKVARDHVHVFVSYRPTQDISQIMQWFKGISSRRPLAGIPAAPEAVLGRHLWARGYLAVSTGTITDEMVREYIDEQQGESIIDDSRFPIDGS